MGFQALLFCPDEKTARAVTQVLSELEFDVEPCNEPFAAVKKMMGAHFDAIVVDCDNEQNAALLFKSARSSSSNQASLAVAVVEGQAGVAKAFRIGANLVLTKPINIEQAKGTLRVARGLLRKGDPSKSAAPTATAAAPVKPPASTPAAPAAPVARAIGSPVAKPAAASASSASFARNQAAPAAKDSGTAGTAVSKVPPPPVRRVTAQVFPAAKPPVAAAPAVPSPVAGAKPVTKPGAPPSSVRSSGGAASAPAPAREVNVPAEVPPVSPAKEDDEILESPAATKPSATTEPAKDVPPPSFTFGGANAPAKSSGTKKILFAVAAAVIVAVGLYAGWTYYHGHMAQSVSTTAPAKLAAPSAPAPSGVQTTSPAHVALTANNAAEAETPSATTTLPKPGDSDSSAATKPGANAKQKTPLLVKGGATPIKATAAEPDTAAPSLIGIAAPSSSGLPNLGTTSATKPVLQRLSISQGVSAGLLIKRVNPVYPPTAVSLRIEGPVQLLATVSKDGDITHVKVLSGDRQLSAAAVEAVKRWKYKPYLLNGEPFEIETQITINFKLPH